ncbi:MAG: WbqC family protein [Bacillota bacterium]|nr:WbqC family protein [Bacillota bacterium]
MILTAHQPVYLPWLGLFHKIILSDSFCFFDDVQYQVRDWNNRNKIKTANGEVMLTVPVLTQDYRSKKIREIEINNTVDWSKKHWKSIYLSYKKAPFFSKYADFFEDMYNRQWIYLTDLCEYMLKFFLQELDINVKYYKASDIIFDGAKSELVLDMCKKLNADLYIFGALGKDYADQKEFNDKGIKLYFQDYKHPEYPQLWGSFISHMSVIDLIFNVGALRAKEIIMEGNITRQELCSAFLRDS